MREEIKVVHAPIEKALSDLRSSIQSLETSFSKEVKGQSNLDIVNKMNDIKRSYDDILATYQALLIDNIEATKQATEQMKETEARLASSMHVMK